MSYHRTHIWVAIVKQHVSAKKQKNWNICAFWQNCKTDTAMENNMEVSQEIERRTTT